MSSSSPATGAPSVRHDRRPSLSTMVRSTFGHRVSLLRPINVGMMAEKAADTFGDSVPIRLDEPFVWDPGYRSELDHVAYAGLVEQVAAALAAVGVGKWDRVAVLKSRSYDAQVFVWAAARIGAIAAPLSGELAPSNADILLDRLRPRVVVTDAVTAHRFGLTRERLRDMACTMIGVDDVDGATSLTELWNSPPVPPSPLKDDEPMVITHTSSTTGVPKLGEASAAGVTFSARIEAGVPFGYTRDDLVANATAHGHVRGTIQQMARFSRGVPMLGVGNPDPEHVRELFARHRPTMVEAHPNDFMSWETVADDPSGPFADVRFFINTFDAIHPRTIRRLLNASTRSFPLWFDVYGMTETQLLTISCFSRRSIDRRGGRRTRGLGWTVPGARVRIADPETGRRRLRQSEPGMIQARTPARTLGFVGTPEQYSQRRHGRWFDTGDWGRRGRWNQLELLDRVADRIDGVASCIAAEDVLLDRIPDATEVVLVPDGVGRPIPVVCMRDGAALSRETWTAAASELGDLEDPVLVSADELERTATAKSRRHLLSAMVAGRVDLSSGSVGTVGHGA